MGGVSWLKHITAESTHMQYNDFTIGVVNNPLHDRTKPSNKDSTTDVGQAKMFSAGMCRVSLC